MLPDLESQFNNLRRRIAADPLLSGLDILAHTRPSIRLNAERVALADVGLGETRIGGTPDLPPGFEWPRWVSSPERTARLCEEFQPVGPAPLGFIAQLDLSALPRIDEAMPDRGWLYFFYDQYCQPWGFDPDDRGSSHVYYSNCDRNELVRTEPPEDADGAHLASTCRVREQLQLIIPRWPDGLEFNSPAFEPYCQLENEMIESVGAIHHRLLGHPQIIQNPMERECQLASNGIITGIPINQADAIKALEPGIADWRLLLQIDSDDDGPGWMWGDVGRIYFWIRQQDLQALRFDGVWLVLQCH